MSIKLFVPEKNGLTDSKETTYIAIQRIGNGKEVKRHKNRIHYTSNWICRFSFNNK